MEDYVSSSFSKLWKVPKNRPSPILAKNFEMGESVLCSKSHLSRKPCGQDWKHHDYGKPQHE
jgi:hypothetical protein